MSLLTLIFPTHLAQQHIHTFNFKHNELFHQLHGGHSIKITLHIKLTISKHTTHNSNYIKHPNHLIITK
jgi:hypothetical protein